MTNIDFSKFEFQLKGKLKAKVWHVENVNADWTKTTRYLACLENYFIVASGKTLDEAKSQLKFLLVGNLAVNIEHNQMALEGIDPTPQDIMEIPADEIFYVDPFNGVIITRGKR